MNKQNYIFVILGVVLLIAGSVMGATSKGNVHPNLKLSFTERFRMVSWDNAISLFDSLDNGNSFTRHRTSMMGQWWPAKNFELGLKLTNEFRYYFVPEDRDFTFDEVIVDQLYFKWVNTELVPGTLTLGRQNIILGEGFVMMDGHPLDGSRSIYFNGARYDWKVNSENTVTAFYVYQDDYDELLPVIHDQDKLLIEQPEEAFGVYYIKENEEIDFQAYAIRKNIEDTDKKPTESEINTLGSRLKMPFAGRFTFTVEGAYQFGEFGDVDRSTLGGYAYCDYKTKWPVYLPATLTAGTYYLNGDDPDTDDWEGWEPLFGRWPKWSESYIYTLTKENGVAYWSNILSLYGKVDFKFTRDVSFNLCYQHLMAPQESNFGVAFPRGRGKNRGDLIIGKLNYKINKHLTGHLLWESFMPGSYYSDDTDNYNWARMELMFSY